MGPGFIFFGHFAYNIVNKSKAEKKGDIFMGYDRFHFGSLYFEDKEQNIEEQNIEQDPTQDGHPVPYDGISNIFIGKTEVGAAIHWIKPKGMNLFIANRVLMNNISWNDLAKNSFVQGKKIIIDGQHFLCRLLQVGEDDHIPNEWDRILDETGEENILWHWRHYYFWGKDAAKRHPGDMLENPYELRGCYGARQRGSASKTSRLDSAGFRPALEVIPAAHASVTHTLEGQNFQISSVPGDKMFCPILQPIKSDVFKGIPEGKQVKMYTVLEDGVPHRIGDRFQNKSHLRITDKFFGEEFLIPWTISNGVAVADNTLYQQE